MRALSAVLVVLTLILGACAGGGSSSSASGASSEKALSLGELAALNQGKVGQLSVGMTKKDVLTLMGSQGAQTRDGAINNPWTVETFAGKDGAQYETLYYITRKNPPFTPVRKSLATPIVLKNGRVVGWGENALSQYK